jgi:hypothetical protein
MVTAILAGWTLAGLARDDGTLSLADLAAYRAAIDPDKPAAPAPKPAGFRDLWDRPAEYQGRRVAVQGRVERVFHQGAVGQFPALAEVWVIDPATDPLCLVFPESPDNPAPKPGDRVHFDGTFLRRIRYRGGDVDRLAPLIVGPGHPAVEPLAMSGPPASRSPFEGVVVAVLAATVVLALLRAHLRRPLRRPIVDAPPPEFQDGHPHGYDGGGGMDEPGRD